MSIASVVQGVAERLVWQAPSSISLLMNICSLT